MSALIGLGSNLGNRRQTLDDAVDRLSAIDGVMHVRRSLWRTTKAVGAASVQPDFLNGAALIETSLSPQALWRHLQQIEKELGRRRDQRWGPRTIDLDLLLLDDVVCHAPPLELPHPRMALRRFVLEPAAEIAGSMRHPTIGWTVSELLTHLQTARPYLAITCNPLEPAVDLAKFATAETGWRWIADPNQSLANRLINSPSLTRTTAIEFLRETANCIAINQWPPHSPGAVSSFWIEDALAIGDVLWPGVMDQVWQGLAGSVVSPKLLVSLDATSPAAEVPVKLVEGADSIRSPDLRQLRQSIDQARRKRAQRPGIGPVLWLDAQDLPAAQIEIRAAIQSMS